MEKIYVLVCKDSWSNSRVLCSSNEKIKLEEYIYKLNECVNYYKRIFNDYGSKFMIFKRKWREENKFIFQNKNKLVFNGNEKEFMLESESELCEYYDKQHTALYEYEQQLLKEFPPPELYEKMDKYVKFRDFQIIECDLI